MINKKISVVTVCFNEEKNIEKTIKSVISQTYFINIEFIIIDGDSSDRTMDIIKRYKDKIDIIVSEKDKGLYDAMNKGIIKSSGAWIQFLNSGDIYSSNTIIEDIFFSKNYKEQILYGRSNRVTNNGNTFPLPDGNHFNLLKGPTFRHGACFINSDFHKQNLYKIDRKDLGFALDYKFLLDAFMNGKSFLNLDLFILNYQEEGVSANKFKSIIYIYRIINDYKKSKFLIIKIIYKYLKVIYRYSFLSKPQKAIKFFIINWLGVKIISNLPFWFLRSVFFKLIGIKIGRNTFVCQGFEFMSPANISIGKNSNINRKCYIDGRGGCVIGNNTSISHEVLILTGTHDLNSSNFKEIHKPVFIGNNVWIGARALILPGVRIEDGAVISAGALVTKDVDSFSVVAGIPAKQVSIRNQNLNYECKWNIPFT